MKTKEIIEGNKLIAEFMGVTQKENNWYDGFELHQAGLPFRCGAEGNGTHELKFDTSWDWLMSVVEKISSLSKPNFTDEINRKRIEIFKKVDIFSTIEWVYKSVIEFIKWYNQNK